MKAGGGMEATGTVRFVPLEGGFFAVSTDDGITYDPMNLPSDFAHDGLRVRFRASLVPGRVGFHMAGPIVEIITIERI